MARGATMLNFMMIFGLMVIGAIVIASLKEISFHEIKKTESEVGNDFVEKIIAVIEEMESYQNNANFTLYVKSDLNYRLEIRQNKIITEFPDFEITIEKFFPNYNVNVFPAYMENSGSVNFYLHDKNLLISDEIICNITDEICDYGCVISDICDPVCYSAYENNICSFVCVDVNGDHILDVHDLDGKCDPDCYNHMRNAGIYDPDCVESGDFLCDPDTHLVLDSRCDGDCKGTNGVCDLDCWLGDLDCPHKDNQKCEVDFGENCLNSPDDCPCSEWICRQGCVAFEVNESGCIDPTLLKPETDNCINMCECEIGLECNAGHCCPEGTTFDGTECIDADGQMPTGGVISMPETKHTTFCGNDICDVSETHYSCPDDCPSGGKDKYCDAKDDGLCDPDCYQGDPDCAESGIDYTTTENAHPPVFIAIGFGIALIALVLFLALREGRNQKLFDTKRIAGFQPVKAVEKNWSNQPEDEILEKIKKSDDFKKYFD